MEGKNAIDVLTGGMKPDGQDYKAQIENLQRELQTARVEQGRVKKLDERIKELERQLAESNAKRREESLVGALSQSERELVDPAVASAAAKIASAAIESERKANEERFARLEKERSEERMASREAEQRAFMERIGSTFPGFLDSVGPGGKNQSAWNAYLVHNRGSVSGAIAECDFGTIDYHIRAFCSSIEIPVPEKGAEAVASPVRIPTGVKPEQLGTAPGKTYTVAEYEALEKKALVLRSQGRHEEYRKLADELDKALEEGRVK